MVTCMLACVVKRSFSTLVPMCFNCSSVKVVFLKVRKPMHQLVQRKNAVASLLPLPRFWSSSLGTRYTFLSRTICEPQTLPPFYFHIIWMYYFFHFLITNYNIYYVAVFPSWLQKFWWVSSIQVDHQSPEENQFKLMHITLNRKESAVCERASKQEGERKRERGNYNDMAWEKLWLTTFGNL